MIAATRKYPVIYADPPWSFQNFRQKGEGRNAIAHYDCLDAEALANLPVADYAAPDCTLLMWATDPLLPQALRIIETVGFYWAKLNKAANPGGFTSDDVFSGLGYWTRANVEQCLLATRGKPRRISKSVRKLCVAPRREHSRKPEEIYSRIEALIAGPYLELFVRETRPGWDQCGDQAGLFDQPGVRPNDCSPGARDCEHFALSCLAQTNFSNADRAYICAQAWTVNPLGMAQFMLLAHRDLPNHAMLRFVRKSPSPEGLQQLVWAMASVNLMNDLGSGRGAGLARRHARRRGSARRTAPMLRVAP